MTTLLVSGLLILVFSLGLAWVEKRRSRQPEPCQDKAQTFAQWAEIHVHQTIGPDNQTRVLSFFWNGPADGFVRISWAIARDKIAWARLQALMPWKLVHVADSPVEHLSLFVRAEYATEGMRV